MLSNEQYFDYLRGRGRIGLLYRRLWLYPRLCSYLDGKVLDVGCGVGDMLSFRPNTTGVDINPLLVDWCRRQGLDAHVMNQNVLPFDDAGFSGAILDNVLEHLDEPSALVSEIRRILAPGGKLVVGVPGRKGYRSDPDHKRYYDVADLKNTFLIAGFDCDKTFRMPLPFPWLDDYLRQFCTYAIFTRRDRLTP